MSYIRQDQYPQANTPRETNDLDDDWQMLADSGPTLGQLPEQQETEASFLWAALNTLNKEVTIDEANQPVAGIAEGVSAIRDTITTQLTRADRSYDIEQRFRDVHNTTSAYNEVIVAFLKVIDTYTAQWGYGNRTLYRIDAHQAGESIVTKLLSILEEDFDHVAFSIAVGEEVDARYMHVDDERPVPTLDKTQVGKVAKAVSLGFKHHSGDVARLAAVHAYRHQDTIPSPSSMTR